MSTSKKPAPWGEVVKTGRLILANGVIIEAIGLGATGAIEGEVCFNTALTGYQEILTDPSYRGQIVTFTFPHIGNVGTNSEDIEDLVPEQNFGAVGAIFKAPLTDPANYRATQALDQWLQKRGLIALCGVDTRGLTHFLRENGMQNAVIAHQPSGLFDTEKLLQKARQWSGLEGADLAKEVSSQNISSWRERPWTWSKAFKEEQKMADSLHVVVVDYGTKRNILRLLATFFSTITVVPAQTPAKEILALKPDGVVLSNGPGDPAATGSYAVPIIQELLSANIPLAGICLGHQLLALAAGAKTVKMHQGHHGANHPIKNLETGKVEIVSMNHGFAVDRSTLPANIKETHISLFDQSNCGLALIDKPAFSVQYHPEASPGPQDSHYFFKQFYDLCKK